MLTCAHDAGNRVHRGDATEADKRRMTKAAKELVSSKRVTAPQLLDGILCPRVAIIIARTSENLSHTRNASLAKLPSDRRRAYCLKADAA